MKTIHFKQIDSTNTYAKTHDTGEDVIITAERQTGGRGTKGRSFISDEGGLYITVVRHNVCATSEAFQIMVNGCVAVCKTLQHFGIEPTVKWANDVLVNGKKICGTLIENTFSGSQVSRSVVGIGLNIHNSLPAELKDIATTMQEVSGKLLSVEEVRDTLIQNLTKTYSVQEYKSYISWFNKKVKLILPTGEKEVIAIDVEEDGRLVCLMDGETVKISAGEVSLRL